MKKLILVLILLAATSVGFISSYAADDAKYDKNAIDENEINYAKTPLNKLGRGLVNTATCWAEIPAKAFEVSEQKDPFIGSTLGVLEGTATAVIRGATGLFDTFTFFMPPYDEPKMKPEYALQELDEREKSYLW